MSSPTGKLAVKLSLYGVFILYLVGDLFVWHGYLDSKMASYLRRPTTIKAPDESKPVAVVYGETITSAQWKRRMAEQAILMAPPLPDFGPGIEATAAPTPRNVLTSMALTDLINSSLIRLKASLNDTTLPDVRAHASRELANIKKHFDNNPEAYSQALHASGSDEGSLLARLQAILKQAAHLTACTDEATTPKEKELRLYYDLIKDQLRTPDRCSVRHIFLPDLHTDATVLQEQINEITAKLNAGARFDEIARQYSQDEKSSENGGDLGTVGIAAFRQLSGIDLTKIPIGTPTTVKGKWGYHIILAGSTIPGGIPSFEEAKPVITHALESLRRVTAIDLYLQNIRMDARRNKRLSVDTKPTH